MAHEAQLSVTDVLASFWRPLSVYRQQENFLLNTVPFLSTVPFSIYKHYHLQHNSEMPERLIEQFNVIAKCNGKFDCLVNEMLYIRMRKPTLNVQTDSIRAKVFV